MPEPRDDFQTSERYEETVDPKNPPNAIINQPTINRAFWSYVGPILALFVIAGIALLYWMSRGPVEQRPASAPGGDAIGTAGERAPDPGSPGGFEPRPRPGSTADELKVRGATDEKPVPGFDDALTLKGVDAATQASAGVGRRVEFRDVEVDSVEGNTFWARQGNARIAVMAPPDSPAKLGAGMHVNVSGTIESDGKGGKRVRATNVEVRQ